ncbi:hypothetical protein [Gordonia hankookensis]|uniref:Uncharacterized protein n=1 Tax=Gordonia hankookensis TaxID=589403 RepID=A0ABR7WL46_9ACTN|nr:hypothetical protein [Gordonia hankookensis]MBD1322514.1 hypothetical protein [Gordonia hankookensis]NDZ97550.1 hypothetical protein [Streptomyces sp. SID11726]NEB26979.1 hypothetical protein [Streptomyces sp. SID6673]
MRRRLIAVLAACAAVATIGLAGSGPATAACMGNGIDDLTAEPCGD